MMKAVIMAGGEGRRLRPLTCTVPKPMARLLGKPIIEYIFDLLCNNGVTDAAVTLGYMPYAIEKNYEAGYKNLTLRFIREDEPLGTAGSVKKAAADFTEPFVVISGDAVCNFDLEKIMLFHKSSNAKVTIVAVEASDPREYGVIKVTRHNRVTGFIEKPSWNQAVSNLASTGVYIIEPECLELVPNGKGFDFAADLFPLMLEKDMPIFCYHTDAYWCDVGNTEAYLKCQRDAFDGKIPLSVTPIAEGVYVRDELPCGDYSVVPPVYIGENAEISDGAVIGPYAVVDDNCFIGKNVRVKYSAVLENSWLAAGTSVSGALVCSGAALKNRSVMLDNSVAGAGCVIGENAKIMPGVCVWPGKLVGAGVNAYSHIRYGSVRAEVFGENGVDEKSGMRLTPEACVRLGAAIGNTRNGKKIAVGTDGSGTAEIMSFALTAGLAGAGSAVRNFGVCFEAQLNFLVNFCELGAGLFVCGKDERSVRICGEGGLSIPRFFEREIENGVSKGEFREASENEIRSVEDMSDMKQLYAVELLKQAPYGLRGIGASFVSENEKIKNLLEGCVIKLGGQKSNELIFTLNDSGTRVSARTGESAAEYERLLALCCLDEMKNGRDIAVPYCAPAFLDLLAEKYDRKVCRYLSTPADNSDSAARQLAVKQVFVRDGLFLALKILSIMKERGMSLDELLAELPEKYIVKKVVPINFSPVNLSSLIGAENTGTTNDFEGVRLFRSCGRILVVPERTGERVRIFAEADTAETANELCADIEEMLDAASEKN